MMSKAVKPLSQKLTKIGALVLAGCGLLGGSVWASGAQASERVEVARNNIVRIVLPASAGSVVVGNPNIADVNVVDSRTMFIIGRGFGTSAVTVVDRQGRTIFDSQVIVSAGQRDSVMLYKGTKSSLMVCSTVCTAADDDTTMTGAGQSVPQQAYAPPAAPISVPAAPGASGAAMALQQ